MSLDRSAHAMRSAARDLVHTATGPDGSALAALVAALVTRRWHEVKNHARQAVAARQAVRHLQAAADMALAPTLAALRARRPRDQARRVFANEVRAAVPDHTERILADLAWPALATVLADAEARGHQPHRLLKEAAAQRELTTARQPARALITRIQHTGRHAAPKASEVFSTATSSRMATRRGGCPGRP
ncbi:hypothetical protein HGI09_29930 [Streptomyces collinus]|nr:hypothetical protein HGI10_34190 [Streptomyces collinus]UJA15667.1 hypothetical protein HGI09_29930 [Streptomyces collinus]